MITSCSKNYLSDLQQNPNALSTNDVTPQLILPAAITGITDITNGLGYSSQAVWEGYWNGQPGIALTNIYNYVMTNTDPQLWDNYYGVLTNLNALVQASQGVANSNYRDIANILETICFKNLVDLYNDVPYSQALKASQYFYPVYDDGSVIYDSLTAKLNGAISDIYGNLNNQAVIVPANDDIMFGGNMQNWLLLANTLKLRLLVNESGISAKQSYIAIEIKNTSSFGYLVDDALVNPGYNAAQPSPMWGAFGVSPSGILNAGNGQFGANQSAIDFYTFTQDFRLPYFYSPKGVKPNSPDFNSIVLPPDYSNFVGNYCGNQTAIPGGGSGIGPGILKGSTQSAVMLTAAESYFIQAEAMVRGLLPGGNESAQKLYQNAITKSYEYLGVGGSQDAADIIATFYFSQDIPFVAFPLDVGPDSLIHTILMQKWAALNSISMAEPYNDWRRTFVPDMESGYPIVPVSLSLTNTAPHMPFRYYYPLKEQTTNSASWVAAGGQSIDPFVNKIFWMK
jgi:hypothetical protein